MYLYIRYDFFAAAWAAFLARISSASSLYLDTGWPVKHGIDIVHIWYLGKINLSSVQVAYTGQVTFYKVPEKTGYV